MVWNDIRDHDGSVQHLSFLNNDEKDVFKTFPEINQFTIINQASERQEFIDQSQSLNIMVNPNTPTKELNDMHITAWKKGVKTLYYQHSTNASQQLSLQKVSCVSCEG